ncbi:MAG: cytochrome c peroxidase [Elusimicrobiota bacterium]
MPGRTPAASAEPQPAVWRGHAGGVTAAVFSPDGETVLSVGSDDALKLWDVRTGTVRASWDESALEVDALAFTPDGKTILAAGRDHSLLLLDAATGAERAALRGHYGAIRAIALSPDGQTAATASFYGAIKLWDLRTKSELATLHHGPDAGAVCLAFSPDGRRLVSGMWHKVLWVWDVGRRERIAVLKGHTGRVLSVAFSPDGKKLLSGGRDTTLRLWDADSGAALGVWRGHTSHVNSVAFSPDGRTALSGGSDYTLRKWDTATGRTLAVWRGHQGDVRSVAFSPDGALAVSTSEDRTLWVWKTDGAAGAAAPSTPGFTPVPPAGENPEAWLGRLLFFDRRLSGNSSLSCASCHDPRRAFTDEQALSDGYPDTLYFRNTPTLINAAKQKHLYWDGRFPGDDMPSLIRDHISEAHFMNADGRLLVEKLRQAPGYVQLFQQVYGAEPSYGKLLEALTAFVRTLNSAAAPYDRDALTPAARRGLALFTGDAGCARCHPPPRFTDGMLHRRGVPENSAVFAQPRRHISFRRFFKMLGVDDYPALRADPGLYAVTKRAADRGRFKTPSLRESARTAPYMHNGVFATLAAAVRHEDPRLSDGQVGDIVAFLESLSSATPAYAPPLLPEFGLRDKRPAVPAPEAPARAAAAAHEFPPLAPLPPVPVPEDNPLTPEKIALGGMLFHDFRIAGDGETYCMACHEPAMGWGDSNDVSQGHAGSLDWRNTQTLLNAAYYSKLNWDGAKISLEEQARSAITSNLSGNGDMVMIEERLAQVPEFVEHFKRAFGIERPNFESVLKALASFIRAVPLSRGVPFDAYMKGDTSALSAAAVRGRRLFAGKAGCIQCHNGALVSDQDFHATGVPGNPAFDHIALRFQHAIHGVPEAVYRDADADSGLYLVTQRAEDAGKFRTPSLRELKVTAPYMHNGVFATLEEVIEFYDQGGGATPNKSPRLKPLKLAPQEKQDLLAFLESLSGTETPAEYAIAPEPDYITFDGRGRRVK